MQPLVLSPCLWPAKVSCRVNEILLCYRNVATTASSAACCFLRTPVPPKPITFIFYRSLTSRTGSHFQKLSRDGSSSRTGQMNFKKENRGKISQHQDGSTKAQVTRMIPGLHTGHQNTKDDFSRANRPSKKQKFPSPSSVLSKALEEADLKASLPYKSGREEKPDLSYGSRGQPFFSDRSFDRTMYTTTLQSVLARYVRRSQTALQEGNSMKELGSSGFSIREKRYLTRRGFLAEDVACWARIVSSNSCDVAARLLLDLAQSSSNPESHPKNKAPPFLLMFLLRRKQMTSHAFRLLLMHALDVMNNTVHPKSKNEKLSNSQIQGLDIPDSQHCGQANYQELDWMSLLILHVRLIRNARMYWPESIPIIIETMLRHPEFNVDAHLRPDQVKRLTFFLNRFLYLLSLPTHKDPFQSAQFLREAQNIILRHMTAFNPAISVNREGYRAIVSVQLRLSKDDRERDWAYLQSKSWPPWKEDKYGLDAEKDTEYGRGRAKRTLMRSIEAGYKPLEWEKAAGIFAGWDTDDSPTIQTRAILQHSRGKRNALRDLDSELDLPEDTRDELGVLSIGEDSTEQALVWAARIEATRTLDEAWSCFLAYRSVYEVWSHPVCFAMFRKIVYTRVLGTEPSFPQPNTRGSLTQYPVVPGDNLQVWKTSENPRERPYLPEPPPNEHAFMDEIVKHGVQPERRFLAFAISQAENLGVGFQYIHVSSLPPAVKSMLLGSATIQGHFPSESIPRNVLTSYISLLCRFYDPKATQTESLITTPDFEPAAAIQACGDLLRHCIKILTSSEFVYSPLWWTIFKALTSRKGSTEMPELNLPSATGPVGHWRTTMRFLEEMRSRGIETDFNAFVDVCALFVRTISAIAHISHSQQDSGSDADLVSTDRLKATFLGILDGRTSTFNKTEGAELLKPGPIKLCPRSFEKGAEESSEFKQDSNRPNKLPKLVNAPAPYHLHAFVRALGKARDYQGIVDLLEWMRYFSREIKAKAASHRSGKAQLRQSVVAARVMLEQREEEAEGANVAISPGRDNVRPHSSAVRSDDHYGDGEDSLDGDGMGEDGSKKKSHDQYPGAIGDPQITSQDCEEADWSSLMPAQQARQIVESEQFWGPWPSDEECEEYCRRGRGTLSEAQQ